MPFAQGSRSGLNHVVEATFGVTPVTPTMVVLPFNTHSLNLSKANLESGEIRSDRQIAVQRHGNRQTAGDVVTELRAADHDNLLESAFFGAFALNVLKVGIVPKFITLEDAMSDVAQYRVFTGMACSKADFRIEPNRMVEVTFGMVGKDMSISGAPLSASPTAASGNQPFDAYSGSITEGGAAIATVTGLSFTIDNSVAPTFVVGSAATPQLEYGRARVTGTVTAYFENATLLNKFISETASSIVVAVTDGTNTYTFTFPNVKYSGGDLPVENEVSRVLTMPFTALYDAGEGTNLKLVKS